ncbi:nucleotidyltransferase domain-containing protein [Pyrococcus kukulkanii]
MLRKVQEDESVRLVMLFGSLARGEVRETSDLT